MGVSADEDRMGGRFSMWMYHLFKNRFKINLKCISFLITQIAYDCKKKKSNSKQWNSFPWRLLLASYRESFQTWVCYAQAHIISLLHSQDHRYLCSTACFNTPLDILSRQCASIRSLDITRVLPLFLLVAPRKRGLLKLQDFLLPLQVTLNNTSMK